MKRIKDPLYGYIEIDDEYESILDSVYFQRLRNVIQTSYTSVYPSSLHNRFAHSLGVYQLGKLAFDSLMNNSDDLLNNKTNKTKSKYKKIRDVFVLACLCHDLGHSPFSHTGEIFYKKENLSLDLEKKVNNQEYSNDLAIAKGPVGKEHEIMSALLSLEVFGEYIEKDLYEFFSRCIIGLQYNSSNKNSSNKIYYLKRSCVELLNSSIIDVDKLDYLIRDSYMSGYNSIIIDYKRLLSGVGICTSLEYPICYKKNSLSVLEAVLTAHDMERRWIQSHPVILYESYLLKTIIHEVENHYSEPSKSLFSLEALTEKGVPLGNNLGSIRLLSDNDILFLSKLIYEENDAIKEYYNRDYRRHSFWKSEAEYKVLFKKYSNSKLLKILKSWEEILGSGEYGVYSINEIFLQKLKEQVQNMDKNSKMKQKQTFLERINSLRVEIDLLEEIKKFFKDSNLPFDFVIISQEQFKPNILKDRFKKIPIKFPNLCNKLVNMEEVTTIPLDITDTSNFFYIFYKKTADINVDVEKFANCLMKAGINIGH